MAITEWRCTVCGSTRYNMILRGGEVSCLVVGSCLQRAARLTRVHLDPSGYHDARLCRRHANASDWTPADPASDWTPGTCDECADRARGAR